MTACQSLPPLVAEQPQHAAAVDALVERAFGPGRYAKAAERLREGNRLLAHLSPVALGKGRVLGSVRMWPIRIGAAPAVLLGPIAVDQSERSRGLGGALARWACEASRADGRNLVFLVGDMPFFGPLGFSVVPPGRIAMPGPVDPRRVLWLAMADAAAEAAAGQVRAAPGDWAPAKPG